MYLSVAAAAFSFCRRCRGCSGSGTVCLRHVGFSAAYFTYRISDHFIVCALIFSSTGIVRNWLEKRMKESIVQIIWIAYSFVCFFSASLGFGLVSFPNRNHCASAVVVGAVVWRMLSNNFHKTKVI